MNLTDLPEILKDEPSYREQQVYHALFSQLIESWDEATNLSKGLREKLKAAFPLELSAEIRSSTDKKSLKAALRLIDGETVETVLIRHRDGRNTVCVSSQAGCPLKCTFCLTGRSGWRRNLVAAEIVDQVLLFARLLHKEEERVSNVVMMGMGEPFINYAQALSAVRMLNRPDMLGIGARKISISTVGIVEGIKKLAQEPLQINLALSLHAPDDARREKLIPVNRKYPIAKVLAAVSDYIEKTRRRVMIEYLMLKDFNDSEDDAKKLAALLKKNLPRLYFVNLIACNPGGPGEASPSDRIKRFKAVLESERIAVVERFRFGDEIGGACGQLAGGKADVH
jgi:23S rRNA (adenine2503-C2)-methyltransferase